MLSAQCKGQFSDDDINRKKKLDHNALTIITYARIKYGPEINKMLPCKSRHLEMVDYIAKKADAYHYKIDLSRDVISKIEVLNSQLKQCLKDLASDKEAQSYHWNSKELLWKENKMPYEQIKFLYAAYPTVKQIIECRAELHNGIPQQLSNNTQEYERLNQDCKLLLKEISKTFPDYGFSPLCETINNLIEYEHLIERYDELRHDNTLLDDNFFDETIKPIFDAYDRFDEQARQQLPYDDIRLLDSLNERTVDLFKELQMHRLDREIDETIQDKLNQDIENERKNIANMVISSSPERKPTSTQFTQQNIVSKEENSSQNNKIPQEELDRFLPPKAVKQEKQTEKLKSNTFFDFFKKGL